MPWVRIDEHALNHIKILALSDRAFRLWVEGLAHCQKHLTDGAISRVALRSFRYAGKARVDELTARTEGQAPLWTAVEDGYQVHDYLIWNDSREKVLSERSKARERLNRFRERNAVSNAAHNADETVSHVHDHKRTLPDKAPGEGASPPDVTALSDAWNRLTEAPIPRCRELSATRRRKIASRLRERPLEAWVDVIERIQRSAFCRGENDRGWVASFDWLVGSPDVAVKVLEGKYDNREPAVKQRPFTAAEVERFEAWRRALNGCGHRPICESRADCMHRFILERRGVEAA